MTVDPYADLKLVPLLGDLAERNRGHPDYYKNWAEIAKIHNAKNRDYAGGQNPLFNLTITELLKIGFPCPNCGKECVVPGDVAIMIRKLDKVIRDINLRRTGQTNVASESRLDTLRDEANYALLEIAALEDMERVAFRP